MAESFKPGEAWYQSCDRMFSHQLRPTQAGHVSQPAHTFSRVECNQRPSLRCFWNTLTLYVSACNTLDLNLGSALRDIKKKKAKLLTESEVVLVRLEQEMGVSRGMVRCRR